MLGESLVPSSRVKVKTSTSLSSLVDNQGPCLGDLLVSIFLVMAVGMWFPVGEFVNEIRSAVEELERLGGLGLVGRKELRSEVEEGIDQSNQGILDSIIGVFRARIAVGSGVLEFFQIVMQDPKSRRNRRTRSLGNNFLADVVMTFTYPLQDSSELESIEGLEESGEGEGPTDEFVRPDFLGWSGEGSGRNGRRALRRHGLVTILVGFSLAGGHVVKWRYLGGISDQRRHRGRKDMGKVRKRR